MSEHVQQQIRRRKLPPTFQHYPAEQAKKLKKAWIRKAQIKSKWKAEKRKLQEAGVLPASVKPWGVNQPSGIPAKLGSGSGDEEGGDDSESDAPQTKRPRQETPNVPHTHRPSTSEVQRSSKKQPRPERPASRTKPSWREEIESSKDGPKRDDKGKSKATPTDPNKVDEPERPPSLRDLKREAYSKTVLHNFKADPLHKRRGQSNRRGRGASAGRGIRRGAANGTGPGRPTGGQPNMKLRMNFVLEKIKRDFTSDPSI